MLVIIDNGRCFSVIGFSPSGPGDFLLSNPLNAAIIFSSLIQSLYLASSSSFVIDVSGYVVSFFFV